VSGGVEFARHAGSASLLSSVDSAFVHALDVMLWCCAGIAVVTAVLALAFLPRRTATTGQLPPEGLPDSPAVPVPAPSSSSEAGRAQ
jgi:hypothetical protein